MATLHRSVSRWLWPALFVSGCAASGTGGSFVPDDVDGGTTPHEDGGTLPTDDSGTTPQPDSGTNPPPSDGGTTPQPDSGTPPDSGTTCVKTPPSNRCGLVPQCGCNSAQTCDVVSTNGSVDCVGAGTQAAGRACTTTSSCANGLTCIFGACRPYCATAGSQCTGTGVGKCIQVKDQSNQDVLNLKVCEINCELSDTSSCGGCSGGLCAGCLFDRTNNATDCEVAGTATQGQACSGTNAQPLCAAGHVCLGPAPYKCSRWCKYPGGTCPTSTTCQNALSNPPVINGQTYGVCL